MAKRVGAIVIISIFILFIFTGCSRGSYEIRKGSFQTYDNSIRGRYQNLTGYYYKEIKLQKGDTINFKFAATTFRGRLAVNLLNSSDSVVELIERDESIVITRSDTYKIKISARNHQGSFELSWEVE